MTLQIVRDRYNGLITEADKVHQRILQSPNAERISFDQEVSGLELSIMKLAKIIRKNPEIQVECASSIIMEKLEKRVTEIVHLVHEQPPEESMPRMAINAFTAGALGGTIHGIVRRNLVQSTPVAEENAEPELMVCASGAKLSDIA